VTFLVEVVVNRAVDCGELLQTSHSSEAKHCSLPSSKWLVGILGTVVDPSANFALVDAAELFQGRAIRCQAIGDDALGSPMALQ